MKLGDSDQKSCNVKTNMSTPSLAAFTQDTSMHGLKYVVGDGYKIRRFFWALAVVGMTATLIYTLCTQMIVFSSYPFLTKYSIGEAEMLDFPAITICNTNGINTNFFTPDEKLRNYLYYTGKLEIISGTINWSDPFYSSWKMDENFIRSVANRLKTMIFIGYWQGKSINITEYFTPRITPNGVCYTFNDLTQSLEQGEGLSTRLTGNLVGLVIAMNIEQEHYYYGRFNMAAGIKVVLHEPHEEPDVMNLGFTVAPGYTSYVAMRHQLNSYLPKPHKAFKDGYCVESHESHFVNPLKYYKHYSQYACVLECEAEFMSRKCGCRTFALPGNATVCTLRQAKECAFPANGLRSSYLSADGSLNILLHIVKHVLKGSRVTSAALAFFFIEKKEFFLDPTYKKECDCPKPCEIRKYKTQLSTAYFPADGVQNYWSNFADIRKNFLELRLFYQELEYDHIEQIPEYTIEGILANLGGQMGLFLGASVLTAMELLEFLAIRLLSVVKKLRRPLTETRVETFRHEK